MPVPASASALIRYSLKSAPTPTVVSMYSPCAARPARRSNPSEVASPWFARPSEMRMARGTRPDARIRSIVSSPRSSPLDMFVPPSGRIVATVSSHAARAASSAAAGGIARLAVFEYVTKAKRSSGPSRETSSRIALRAFSILSPLIDPDRSRTTTRSVGTRASAEVASASAPIPNSMRTTAGPPTRTAAAVERAGERYRPSRCRRERPSARARRGHGGLAAGDRPRQSRCRTRARRPSASACAALATASYVVPFPSSPFSADASSAHDHSARVDRAEGRGTA